MRGTISSSSTLLRLLVRLFARGGKGVIRDTRMHERAHAGFPP